MHIRMLAGIATAALVLGYPGPPAAAQTPETAPLDFGAATALVMPQARAWALAPEASGVALQSVAARVNIVNGTASTTLLITVRNPGVRQEEAVLLLPVPDGATVSAFDFQGSASEPTARIHERGEARRLYDSIVARVKDPALLEFAGYRLLRSSVFPVPPGGIQRVQLTYEHLLERDGARIDYVLPRSESLDAGCPWSIELAASHDRPIATVYSPSHPLAVERTGPRSCTAVLAVSAAPGSSSAMDPGPFMLSILEEEHDGMSASLFAYPDPAIGGGYFLLVAGLPAPQEAAPVRPREVTLVLDRSGSMAGGKMDQVRAAALQVVEGLAPGEAFNIVDYATTVSAFAPSPVVKSDETTLEARRYLTTVRPNGGTNIHDALVEALRPAPRAGMLPIVLFLTDGLPTVGRTREVEIRTMVEAANRHGRRVFTFGVGADVNAPLLDRIAAETRATTSYVLPGADVELAVAQVFRRLEGPVLSDAALRTLDTSGAETTRRVHELIPGAMPDLFEDDQLVLLGQYRDDGHPDDPVRFELSGDWRGQPRTFHFDFGFEAASTRNAFVPRLWASRRIAQLVDAIRQAGAEVAGTVALAGAGGLADPRLKELADEILRLSAEFGVLTEYTAFLATEGTNLNDRNELVLACRTALQDRAVQTRSGLGAVNQSVNWYGQSQASFLNYDNRFYDANMQAVEFRNVRQVCDRAFYFQSNQWIDSRIVGAAMPAPDEIIEFGTDAHRRLVDELIRANRVGTITLPGTILIRHEGRTIQVNNPGC